MYNVILTSTQTGKEVKNKEFLTKKEAYNYFYLLADEHNMDYEQGAEPKEAGGRGYDYRLEILKDEK